MPWLASNHRASLFKGQTNALTCRVCIAPLMDLCEGSTMDCPSGQVCALSVTEVSMVGAYIKNSEFAMSCAPKSMCNTPASASTPNSKIKFNTSCCDRDLCTPSLPGLPEDTFGGNGLTCPTCTSLKSDWCYSTQNMQCTGNERMCLLESTHVYAPIERMVAVRGCATKSMCDLGTQTLTYGLLNETLRFQCTSGTTSLHCHHLLLLITSFSLIKVICL
ncbi:phospholipase A2 inhibitor gamma subunit B-like isoform X2 [Hyperolius riggenbachi]|uniref:phospholipase A2 inhibitor gamma subunit B-like isoform X2 n=1 Tax=Hyperolius riggenbachi TaxID=752182 RepID=UPI0035A3C982